jgi:hypothetical protein
MSSRGTRRSVERGAKVAETHEDDRLEARIAECLSELGAERLDIVTEATRAELTKVGQVLSQLGRLDAGGLGQGGGGDRCDLVGFKALQGAVI